MTCIVGLEHDGRVYIGGDSAGVDGWLNRQVRTDTKVFRAGAYLCGFTTSFRMGQILRYNLNVASPDTWDVDRFMSTTFVDAVRAALKAGGYAKAENGTESGGTFLVGIGARLYEIEGDYQVGRVRCGYAAVGIGAMYALGSLFTTAAAKPSLPEVRCRLGLEAATFHNAGVAAPYVIEST